MEVDGWSYEGLSVALGIACEEFLINVVLEGVIKLHVCKIYPRLSAQNIDTSQAPEIRNPILSTSTLTMLRKILPYSPHPS